jgi:hypothetical protein
LEFGEVGLFGLRKMKRKNSANHFQSVLSNMEL